MSDLVWMVVECLEVLRWLGDELIEKTEGPSFEKEIVEVENPVEIVGLRCELVFVSSSALFWRSLFTIVSKFSYI